MQDNLRYLEKEMQRAQDNAKGAHQQADLERNKADQYDEAHQSDKDYHQQQARQFDDQAEALENEAQQLQAKKVQVEARVAELKTERETLNRETLARITAIDNELISLQGSMSV